MKASAGKSQSETGKRVEQRREPRKAAEGEVRILFDVGGVKGAAAEIRAKLLDRSDSGFHAEHDCPELRSGQLVQFRFKASSRRRARVVWTSILGGRVETGFLILP